MKNLINPILIKITFSLMLIAAMVTNGVDFGTASMVTFGIMSLTLIPSASVGMAARDEVLSRIFSNDLQEKLWPSNEFYSGAQSDPNVALDQESIEIPQDEDGVAQTVVNPKEFPLTTYAEVDTKKTYSTDLIATKPQLVTDLNQMLVSYDKRAAKLRKHQNTLADICAMKIAYSWMTSVAGFKRATTSAEARAASAAGATGTRKRIAKADIFWLMTEFNRLNIPMAGRRLLLNAQMYEDLFTIDEFITSDKLRAPGQLSEGALGRIMGFEVYMRSEVPQVATDGTTKAYGAATATTDAAAALAFHPSFVRYAQGTPKVYIQADRGEYLGTTMNAAVRCGGTTSRLSELGVLALYEGAV